MKKLITIVATVLITSGIFYSCSLLKSLDEVEQNGFICSNYENYPVNEMDKQTVLSMIRNYYEIQYSAIHCNTGITGTRGKLYNNGSYNANGDSRAVFFNLDTLKRLIYYIEKATKQFTVVQKENLGVNIYFASYPQYLQMRKGGQDYTNLHTLVFIPAIFDTDYNRARDFDLNNNLNGTNVLDPSFIDSAFLNSESSTRTIPGVYLRPTNTSGSSAQMNSQNHGTAIPPPPAPTGNAILDLTDPY